MCLSTRAGMSQKWKFPNLHLRLLSSFKASAASRVVMTLASCRIAKNLLRIV